jgi:sugar lactone lactonase YvrE
LNLLPEGSDYEKEEFRVLLISASSCLSATLHSASKLRRLLLAASIPACFLSLATSLQAQVLSYAGAQSTLAVTALTAPAAIALDASGNRYIVNHQAANVTEVSAAGAQSTITVALTNPYAIAVDSDANLYIADYGATHIVKVPAGGGTATSVGSGLLHPTGVALDSAGDVYIADGGNARVVKVAATSGTQTVIGSGFTNPVGLAIDASNNIYVSDIGAQDLYEISSAGSTITVTTVLTGLTADPYDVAVDHSGDILLSGGTAGTVTMYQVPAQLGANGVIRQLGTGLIQPTGMAIDSTGHVYVADQTALDVAIIAPGSIDLGQANLCPAGGTQTGPCSQSVTLNFNIASGATLTSVSARVVTQGGLSLDFTSSANTCTGPLTGPATCSITAAFNPLAPGVRLGAVDVSGIVGAGASVTLLSTVALHGVGIGPLAGFDAGIISQLPVTLQSTPKLASVIADSSGNLYFADSLSCVVEKYVLSTGTTSVVAGSGVCGASAGDGGPATSAVFKEPQRLALSGRGDLYIADDLAEAIRKVDALTGIITTIAGTPGTPGRSPDGTVASTAVLNRPFALAFDGAGNLYYSDYADEVVRKIDPVSGILTTVAGNYNDGCGFSGDLGLATSAQLNYPIGLAIDGSGNLYIADDGNNLVREVAAGTGIITTVAGDASMVPSCTDYVAGGYAGDGGAATSAQINDPEGLAVDAAGNLYIADTSNYVVRKVNAATGLITTIAGVFTGTAANTGAGGAATLSGLSYVQDVAVDSSGNFYIADSGNNILSEVTTASGIVDFTQMTSGGVVTYPTYTIGTSSPAIDVAVTNNGNAALDLTALMTGTNFNTSGADTTCTATSALTPSAGCVLGVEFLPTAAGSLTATLTLTDNAANNPASTQSLALKGTGEYVATQVALGTVPASITSGGNLGTITASIESSGGNVVSNSTVSVTATVTGPGGYSQPVTASAVSGVATLDLSALTLTTVGTYTVTATSSGLTPATATTTVVAAPSMIAVTGIPASIVAGGNLGIATATIEAADGSTVTGSTAQVTITITGTGFSHALTATAVNGVATIDLSGIPITAAGTYTVTTSSPNLPNVVNTVTVALIDFTLAAGSSSQTVAAGAAATYTFTLAPTTSAYSQAITLSATGLPTGATATFAPASVTPGTASATTTLTLQTTSADAALRTLKGFGVGLGGLAFGLLLLPFTASRRLRRAAGRMPIMTLLLGLLSFGAVCGLSGCGGGSSAPKSQTYTITVTGTSGSLTHSATVTLIVQ